MFTTTVSKGAFNISIVNGHVMDAILLRVASYTKVGTAISRNCLDLRTLA